MHFDFYDYITGNLIGTENYIDFGKILQSHHCIHPEVFKVVQDTETNISNLMMYLENKGTWTDIDYNYFINSTFIPEIQSGNLTGTFIEVPDASSTSPNGVSIGWDYTSSYFIWIDVNIPNVRGTNNANYRFFYDHS